MPDGSRNSLDPGQGGAGEQNTTPPTLSDADPYVGPAGIPPEPPIVYGEPSGYEPPTGITPLKPPPLKPIPLEPAGPDLTPDQRLYYFKDKVIVKPSVDQPDTSIYTYKKPGFVPDATLKTEGKLPEEPTLYEKLQQARQKQDVFWQARDVGRQISVASQKAEDDIKREVKTGTGIGWLDQIAQGGFLGVVDAIGGGFAAPLTAVGTIGRLPEGKPELFISEGKDLAVGTADYFVKTLGEGIRENPAQTIPRIVVSFAPAIAEGGLGVTRFAKSAGLAATGQLPARALKIEFDVARLPITKYPPDKVISMVGKAIEAQLTEAPKAGMSRKINIEFPDGSTGELKYRVTPAQKLFPDTLYHATPDATLFLDQMKKGKVTIEGELFTSPQAAMDFMRRSASGTPPRNPGLFAIRTGGKLGEKEVPVFKTYKNQVENEVVTKGGVDYLTTKPTVYSKMRKLPTGATLTQYTGVTDSTVVAPYVDAKGIKIIPTDVGKKYTITRGQIIPTYWLKKPGVAVDVPSVAQRYAATKLAILESVSDLPWVVADVKRLAKNAAKGKYDISWFSDQPLLESRRHTYSGLKIVEKQIESAIKREVKKGATPEEAIIKVTSEDMRRLTDNPAIKRALSDRRVQDRMQVGIGRYMAFYQPRTTRETPRETRQLPDTRYRLSPDLRTAVRVTPNRDMPERIVVPREPPAREIPPREPPVDRVTTEPPRTPPEYPRTPPATPPREPPRLPPQAPPYGGNIQRRFLGSTKKELREAKKLARNTPITWRQGVVWWTVKAPYQSMEDVTVTRAKPEGAYEVRGPKSAYDTLQSLGVTNLGNLRLDLGIMDVVINKPVAGGKKRETIRFVPDPKQKTKGEIALKRVG